MPASRANSKNSTCPRSPLSNASISSSIFIWQTLHGHPVCRLTVYRSARYPIILPMAVEKTSYTVPASRAVSKLGTYKDTAAVARRRINRLPPILIRFGWKVIPRVIVPIWFGNHFKNSVLSFTSHLRAAAHPIWRGRGCRLLRNSLGKFREHLCPTF